MRWIPPIASLGSLAAGFRAGDWEAMPEALAHS